MARRKSQIFNNSRELVSSTISTINNLATLADNTTGMIADASTVMREKSPQIVNKWIENWNKTARIEATIEENELEAELLESEARLKNAKAKSEEQPEAKSEEPSS